MVTTSFSQGKSLVRSHVIASKKKSKRRRVWVHPPTHTKPRTAVHIENYVIQHNDKVRASFKLCVCYNNENEVTGMQRDVILNSKVILTLFKSKL